MNKLFRKKLQDHDKGTLQHDTKIVNLVWRMFHGEEVGRELSEAEEGKAAFVSRSGYSKLIEGNEGVISPRDAREMELRRKALLVDSIKSQPAASEAYQRAGQAQYEFRLEVDGRKLGEGEVGQILSTDEDRGMREKVWRAQEQSLALSSLKHGLVLALNEASGGVSFADVVLSVQDCTSEDLYSLLDSFEKRVSQQRASFMEDVQAFSGLATLEPWDVGFYVRKYLLGISGEILPKDSDNALMLFKKTLKAMGFARLKGRRHLDPESIDKPPFTLSLKGGERFAPEECAISIAPGAGDYRVFVNPELSPTGMDLTRTIFLETGRAIHYRAMDHLDNRVIFRWDNDCMRHAVAMLFDSMLEDEKWLRDIAGLGMEQAPQLSRLLKLKKLGMAINKAANAYFEVELYRADKSADPGELYEGIQRRFALMQHSHDLRRRWAWNPYLAFNPAGELSYILGYQISEKIASDMRSEFGGTLLHRRAAEMLVDRYFTGYETPWKDRIY